MFIKTVGLIMAVFCIVGSCIFVCVQRINVLSESHIVL